MSGRTYAVRCAKCGTEFDVATCGLSCPKCDPIQGSPDLAAEVRTLRAANRRLRAALRHIRTGTDDQWSMDRAREALKPKARRAGRTK